MIAHALGLFVPENEAKKKDFAALIQKFNRWFTNTVAAEDVPPAGRRTDTPRNPQHNALDIAQSLVSRVLALRGQTDNACSLCGQAVSKDFAAHVVDLLYPRKVSQTSC